MTEYCVALTTLGSEVDTEKLISAVLEDKLAACIQTVNIASRYTWKGELCHDQEILLLFKTSWVLYDALESKIKEL